MNRQYEYLKGKNRRGTLPVKHVRLFHIETTYLVCGKTKTRKLDHAATITEAVVAILRDEPQQATFGAQIARPETRQRGLFG